MNRQRLGALLLVGLLLAAAALRAQDRITAFVNVHVVPMDREVVLQDHTVIVNGDRIVELGPSAKVKAPPGATIVDGAGKYLTPSVFVSYGIGLFKPSNTFRIKYLLSSQWAVQAESGNANGGDVVYQLERGR